MFVTQLIPESMEITIVGPVDNVCQLVKHGIYHILDRKELGSITGIAESQTNLLPPIYVQT